MSATPPLPRAEPPPGWLKPLARRFPFGRPRDFVKWKLRLDPVYPVTAAILLRAPDLPLLDLGCGQGVLGGYVRACGFHGPMHGLDYDAKKIAQAQVAFADDPHATWAAADARTGLPEHQGHVTVLDILQFFTRAEQEALVRAAAQRVAPSGWLVIRNTLRGPGWRAKLSHLGDLFAKLTRWMPAAPVEYPSAETLAAWCQAEGLRAEWTPLTGAIPFHNFLLTATRP